MTGPRIHIGRMSLTLPADYAGDAQAFARALKAELGRAGPQALARLAGAGTVTLTAGPGEPPERLALRIVAGPREGGA